MKSWCSLGEADIAKSFWSRLPVAGGVVGGIALAPELLFGTACVLGGSIAGLLAARVLADYAQRVVVIERDDIDANALQQIMAAAVTDQQVAQVFRDVTFMLEHPDSLADPALLERAVTANGGAGLMRRSGHSFTG